MTLAAPRPNDFAALRELFAALRDETISIDQWRQVEKTLQQDARARAYFARLMQLHVLLEHKFADASPHKEYPYPSLVGNETAAPVATLSPTLPTVFPVLTNTLPSTVGWFSSGWPVAYMIATVICGVSLLVGSIVPVSQPVQVAKQSVLPTTFGRGAGGEGSDNVTHSRPVIGRITGMVDCQWVQGPESRVQSPALDSRLSTFVSLGDKFVLASGLLEITYDTGAKVILQGPVTYEVESVAGGFLSVGKLTAKLEKKNGLPSPARGRGAGGEGDSNPQSLIPNPLFAVRTPTATVTDLGTEFGVEVSKEGHTTSHVFRGSVRLEAISATGKLTSVPQVLRANESAMVEKRNGEGSGFAQIVVQATAKPGDFVRRLPKRVPLAVFGTGIGAGVGEPDQHWLAAAISDRHDFQPHPAWVIAAIGGWLENTPGRSQWIAFQPQGETRNGVNYSFRTNFDLTGLRSDTAVLQGRFIADNHIDAIRLNGQEVPVPLHNDTPPFDCFHRFSITSGFVGGTNTLEIVVLNGERGELTATGFMGLRLELSGSAMQETNSNPKETEVTL